jgi:superfamily II DNA or RNA helicase
MTKDEVQKQALQEITKHKKCSVAISMGVGKTRIAIKHAHDKGRCLVVIPKNSLIDSWLEEVRKVNIGISLSFVTYRSLNKKDPEEYDIVILDECHNLKMNHMTFLSKYDGSILGLTGTPPKNNIGEKYYMVNKYCPVVYEFTVDDATSSKILNDYMIYVHMIELSNKNDLKKKKRNGQVWFQSEVKDYNWACSKINSAHSKRLKQMARIMRMKFMMEYKSKELYTKKLLGNIDSKCIIFANTVKQAERLCSHSYHSKNKMSKDNLEMFSDGRINSLSCVLQLSEGINIPNLKQGIILHAYGNERKSAQRIGRLLRLNPNDTSVCHILCYKDTIDETWVSNALQEFDQSKIRYYNG